MKVHGVILAGGCSRRMGCPKQLLDFQGRPLLQHVLDAALASSCLDRIVLVLGHACKEILGRVETSGIQVVRNPGYRDGQSTSVVRGLEAAADGDAVLFLLGDQPLVDAGLLDRIIHAFAAVRPWAVVPEYRGRRGNPVVVGRPLFDAVRGLRGDTGPRRILRDAGSRVHMLPVDNPAVVLDVDTPGQWQALCAGRVDSLLEDES